MSWFHGTFWLMEGENEDFHRLVKQNKFAHQSSGLNQKSNDNENNFWFFEMNVQSCMDTEHCSTKSVNCCNEQDDASYVRALAVRSQNFGIHVLSPSSPQ